mgnify:CR=1 FL=1
MHDLLALIADVGGAADRRFLNDHGFSDRRLRAALRDGLLDRPRRGWYTAWARDDPRFMAMRVGGRLTGLSAIRALGGWVRVRPRLDVAVPVNASRLRNPRHRRTPWHRSRADPGTLNWSSERHDRRTSSGIVPLVEALERVCRTAGHEDAIAAIDWARRSGSIDAIDLAELGLRLPRPLRWMLAASDVRCDSLPESLARTRLRSCGFRVESQVALEGTSPVDLLVEGHVAVEVDGGEFHVNAFEKDRAKDLAITRAGMHALRPSARHVFENWPTVLTAISRALLERGIPTPVAVGNSGDRVGPRGGARREPPNPPGQSCSTHPFS